jgi:1-phosphofructokinase family hexose kinase
MSETKRIITVGLNPALDRTIAVEGFAIGAHQTGRTVSRQAGGKSLNIARTLAAMGVASVATGILGQDNRHEFDALLDGSLIDDRMLVLPGRTRENVTITDPRNHVDTHLRDVGLEVGPEAQHELRRILSELVCPGCLVAFSGSLPPGCGPDDQADMVDQCIQAGASVAVDTSGEALKALAGKPLWLLSPNRQELAELLGTDLHSPQAILAAARPLLGDLGQILCSLGADGAMLITQQAAFRAELSVEQERIVNTVGCGDALLAAMLAAHVRQMPARDALALAVATASASALTHVAGRFDPAQRDELLQQVRVETLGRN